MQQKTAQIAAWSAGHDNNARRWLESRQDAVAGRAKTYYILFGSGRKGKEPSAGLFQDVVTKGMTGGHKAPG